MAKTHSEAFAQYADHFSEPAVALATLRDSDEKKDALLALLRPAGAEDVGRRHPHKLNAVASWHKDPHSSSRMLAYYKDELGKLPGAVREKFL